MKKDHSNVYDDDHRARAYARLEFPGTYYFAFRDLSSLFRRHVRGKRALDFGCSASRSTTYLRDLGFDAVGVDISRPMLEEARKRDLEGDYRLVDYSGPGDLKGAPFDLILSAFTFDNFPGLEERKNSLESLGSLLSEQGRIVNIVSAPEIYVNQWVSFSTRDYPENKRAVSGDRVLIEILDVEDTVCTDEDYSRLYCQAGPSALEKFRPLATGEEQIDWVSETEISTWVTYVLGVD